MSKLLSTAAVLVLGCGLAVADDTKAKDTGKADKGKLVGTYTIVSGERGGKALPKDEFDGSVVKITDAAIVGTDKDKKEFYASTYTLDTSKTPWAITMTLSAVGDAKDKGEKKEAEKGKEGDKGGKGAQTASGLIKMDGDTVTLIYALPGAKTPTDFKTAENQQLFVLKKSDAKKDK